jgi:hypothetical protein
MKYPIRTAKPTLSRGTQCQFPVLRRIHRGVKEIMHMVRVKNWGFGRILGKSFGGYYFVLNTLFSDQKKGENILDGQDIQETLLQSIPLQQSLDFSSPWKLHQRHYKKGTWLAIRNRLPLRYRIEVRRGCAKIRYHLNYR